jgi:hypothetical protein
MPRRSLSLARRVLADHLEQAAGHPTFDLERNFRLGTLARARESVSPPPRWRTLFLKALGLIVPRWPELRSLYRDGWRPYLAEERRTRVAVLLPRFVATEPILFLPNVDNPGAREVRDLDRRLRQLEEGAIETVPAFRRTLRRAAWPAFLRRWFAPLPATLALAVPEEGDSLPLPVLVTGSCLIRTTRPTIDGRVTVTIHHDPRVLDGDVAGRVLTDLEETLLHATLAEVRYLCGPLAA